MIAAEVFSRLKDDYDAAEELLAVSDPVETPFKSRDSIQYNYEFSRKFSRKRPLKTYTNSFNQWLVHVSFSNLVFVKFFMKIL